MFKRIVLIGIVVVLPLTSAHGFTIGLLNVAPPSQAAPNTVSFGTAQAGGIAGQWAQAGGTGAVGQYAWATGGQWSTPNAQLQTGTAGMTQTGVTLGGNSYTTGIQGAVGQLNQTTPTSTQSAYTAGFQGASISSNGGIGVTSQTMTVGIVQIQVQ